MGFWRLDQSRPRWPLSFDSRSAGECASIRWPVYNIPLSVHKIFIMNLMWKIYVHEKKTGKLVLKWNLSILLQSAKLSKKKQLINSQSPADQQNSWLETGDFMCFLYYLRKPIERHPFGSRLNEHIKCKHCHVTSAVIGRGGRGIVSGW